MLAALLLGFSARYSANAPLGAWQNQLLGQDVWREFDPGSYYVATAHELAGGEPPLFVGHPGAPLVLALYGVQRAYYGMAGSAQLSFLEFAARHLPDIFVLSKLLVSLLHLASFAGLYAFARALLRSESAACLAVLGYATSLPVLYYLSRISVEPLVMLAFFAAFLCLWRYQDLARAGRTRAAWGFVALAAASAASGAVAKLHQLGPLPAFLLVVLLADRSAPRLAWRTRLGDALVFCATSAVVLLAWSQLIDWGRFFAYWTSVKPTGSVAAPLTGFAALLVCESAFTALGLFGWLAFLRRHPECRARLAWPSLYAGLALLPFAYRVVFWGGYLPFHYLFVTGGFLAVFAGDALPRVMPRLSLPTGGVRGALAALGCVGLLHATAIYAVVDSRHRDALQYAANRAVYSEIAALGPAQHLGVAGQRPETRLRLPWLHTIPFRGSRLRIAFEALFVPLGPGAARPDAQRLFVPALGTAIVPPPPPGEPTR